MLSFIKTFCIVIAVLLIVRKIWNYVCVRLALRIVNCDWMMNMIKEHDPEYYEKGLELKRLSELLEKLEEET